jgi:hypothetical protein
VRGCSARALNGHDAARGRREAVSRNSASLDSADTKDFMSAHDDKLRHEQILHEALFPNPQIDVH